MEDLTNKKISGTIDSDEIPVGHQNQIENHFLIQTERLEEQIRILEKENDELRKDKIHRKLL